MILNLGKSVGTMWIDDIKLQEGDRNVYRRDYEGGIALVNATAAPVTVNLNGTFRKIKGTQAPTVNDGTLCTSVTLPAQDGIVLLRPAATPVVDTTPPTTTISGVPGGWSKSNVTFSLVAADAGSPSGVSTYYGLNAPAVTCYTAPYGVQSGNDDGLVLLGRCRRQVGRHKPRSFASTRPRRPSPAHPRPPPTPPAGSVARSRCTSRQVTRPRVSRRSART